MGANIETKTKALLAICNNGKTIVEQKIRVNYEQKSGLRLSIGDGNQKVTKKKIKGKNTKLFDYSLGIPIRPIITFVYGKSKFSIAQYGNVTKRLETLIKMGIIKRGGKPRKYLYYLNTDLSTFKKIVRLLSDEKQNSKLIYTEYFKNCGIVHFNLLFNKIPDNLLNLDLSKEDQINKYENYIYSRLLSSPTFMGILISNKLNERMNRLQNSLNASYIRQQGTKNNFPFVQLLGTYCAVIDYLTGDINFDEIQLTECFNDTERMIYSLWKDESKLPDFKK